MNRIISIVLLALFVCVQASYSAPKKVTVRGVPSDATLIGKSKCIAPYLCKKKKAPGLYTYNSGVWGNPKFAQGEVVLRDGTVLKGRVALLTRKQDWGFVKHLALIIPEGETDAWYVGPGYAQRITHKKKKTTNIFDMYGSIYLKRLVSGPIRLSYNPAAGTNKKIADFVSPIILGDIERQARGRATLAALKDGKSLKDAMKSGDSFSGTVSKVIASIEITEKEYLVFEKAKGTTTLVTKANYRNALRSLFSICPQADQRKLKSFKSYKKIKKAFQYLNASCKR